MASVQYRYNQRFLAVPKIDHASKNEFINLRILSIASIRTQRFQN